MKTSSDEVSHTVLLEIIKTFVGNTTGLTISLRDEKVEITQKADDKRMFFSCNELNDVLTREDREGKTFIQVNFKSGRKVLLTDSLVGFKPDARAGLDLTRLPKVVTTPDLMSVFEAIEEIMNSDNPTDHELEVLREVYFSILTGAEAIGFNLHDEKVWLTRLMTARKASA